MPKKPENVFLLLRLAVVALVLACGIFDIPVYALMIVPIFFAYVFQGIRISKGDPAKLESVADQVYFIGYLGTIAAFASVIIGIWRTGEIPSNPLPILVMSGIALLTTVVGLIAMSYLKDMARSLIPSTPEGSGMRIGVVDGTAAGKIYLENQQLITMTEQVTQTVKELNNQLNLLKDNATRDISDLNRQLKVLNASINRLREIVDNGSLSAQLFASNVKQLESVLDQYVQLLEKKIKIADVYEVEEE